MQEFLLYVDVKSEAIKKAVEALCEQLPHSINCEDAVPSTQPNCWVTDYSPQHVPAMLHKTAHLCLGQLRCTPAEFWEAMNCASVVEMPVVRWGEVTFMAEYRQLTWGDTQLDLTEKESDMLGLLAKHADGVTQQRMMEEVWHYRADVNSTTLQTHLYRLRKKLREAHAPIYIVWEGAEISVQTQNSTL